MRRSINSDEDNQINSNQNITKQQVITNEPVSILKTSQSKMSKHSTTFSNIDHMLDNCIDKGFLKDVSLVLEGCLLF